VYIICIFAYAIEEGCCSSDFATAKGRLSVRPDELELFEIAELLNGLFLRLAIYYKFLFIN
jgi:hypothetical protein